jgi:hypothetical protein
VAVTAIVRIAFMLLLLSSETPPSARAGEKSRLSDPARATRLSIAVSVPTSGLPRKRE